MGEVARNASHFPLRRPLGCASHWRHFPLRGKRAGDRRARLLPLRQFPRLFRQHDRHAVADGVGEAGLAADQLGLGAVVVEGAAGDGADQDFQQARINLVQAQANRYADTAALFQALGGGWWGRADLAKDTYAN